MYYVLLPRAESTSSKVRSRTGWNGIRQIYNNTKVCKVKSSAVKEQALQRLYVSTYLDRE
jgi:hypothetical protein